MNPTTDLSPGRELDALIAEKVMGWQIVDKFGFKETLWRSPDDHYHVPVAAFSTDISSAWQVVEHLCSQDGIYFYIERAGATYWCKFENQNRGTWSKHGGEAYERLGDAEADTAPLAICRAALAAIREITPGNGGSRE